MVDWYDFLRDDSILFVTEHTVACFLLVAICLSDVNVLERLMFVICSKECLFSCREAGIPAVCEVLLSLRGAFHSITLFPNNKAYEIP